LFVLAVVSYVFLIIRLSENAEPFDLFIKFLDLITVTVPPGLPISMTFGIIFAL
jgi:magnesium-transporting ATPase (P-type)